VRRGSPLSLFLLYQPLRLYQLSLLSQLFWLLSLTLPADH
jgi:hypothetical protein